MGVSYSKKELVHLRKEAMALGFMDDVIFWDEQLKKLKEQEDD